MVNKDALVLLLKRNGVSDLKVVEGIEVTEENFIFTLNQNKIKVDEHFFIELASILDLPFLSKKEVQDRFNLAAALPYRFQKENLILPLEVTDNRATIVTANPLNKSALKLLRTLLRNKRIELYVASIEAVEGAIEKVYRDIHRNRALWDLYYRNPDESAYQVLYPWQRYLVIVSSLLMLVLAIINYPASFILAFSLINMMYIFVNPLKFYIAFKGLYGSHRTRNITKEDVENLDEDSLPIYTILVPVYKEARMLPNILLNILNMDYPKEKLDVKILIEEGDEETLKVAEKLGLFGEPEVIPSNMSKEEYRRLLRAFDSIIVPEADIRTKPRACNYGLLRAKGQYCVIYDAEDNPEPDQLKKAVVAFSRTEKDCVCLQSRLNFYNPNENILTKWFSLEYSYWYDYYLEGLDRVDAPIPLGGTSNHFRTKQLRELGSWDPYNVTEDADLGIRISRRNLKTAMLNSYTYEEANSRLWNWIRQRSRWYKGHIQTYLVHMRHPKRLISEMGLRKFLLFQLTFGGNIFLPLINPLLWAVTILTLLVPGIFDFLFFYPIIYICMFNLLVGNLVQILLYMVPSISKKSYSQVLLAFTMPIYWVLISIGAWRGALQLITKPFYWEKTSHGISKDFTDDTTVETRKLEGLSLRAGQNGSKKLLALYILSGIVFTKVFYDLFTRSLNLSNRFWSTPLTNPLLLLWAVIIAFFCVELLVLLKKSLFSS